MATLKTLEWEYTFVIARLRRAATMQGVFTGIVEETAEVLALAEQAEAWRLHVRSKLKGVRLGDSVAVNGCCLTVAAMARGVFGFDLLEETLRRTDLGGLRAGARVNLERSLPAQGRFGGHLVSGHIDVAGTVQIFERRGKNHYLRVKFPAKFGKYVVEKGSIAIDGVSLTVAEPGRATLAVWLIPHTLAATNLEELRAGARVNLEFDLVAKYLERLPR